jgi:hypothetical protein
LFGQVWKFDQLDRTTFFLTKGTQFPFHEVNKYFQEKRNNNKSNALSKLLKPFVNRYYFI